MTLNRQQRRALAHKRPERRPRINPAAALNPVTLCQQFTGEEAASLGNEARLAWYRLTSGDGQQSDFDMVANCSNITLVQSEEIGAEAVEIVLQAQTSILEMKARYERTGAFGADAAALATVPGMLDLYDQLLTFGSPAKMIQSLTETVRRVRMQQRANA